MNLSIKVKQLNENRFIAYLILSDCVWKPIVAMIGNDEASVRRDISVVYHSIKHRNMLHG